VAPAAASASTSVLDLALGIAAAIIGLAVVGYLYVIAITPLDIQ
jgi:hypothetical protein